MPNDGKTKKYNKGTKVKVVLCDENETITEGILQNDYDTENPMNSKMPKILLKDGTFVFGYECWWIPVEETK